MTAEDFGSDTLTDLERARTVAVELEQENAVLRQRIDKAQLLCIHEVANSQNYNDPRVPTLDARAVHAALSGDGTVADGAPGIRRVDADPIVGHMYLLDFEPEGVLDGEALVTFTVPNATRWVAGPHLIFRLTGDAS